MATGSLRKQELAQELERRILHGLASEWDTALYVLDAEERDQMRMPTFRLADMKSRLGYWSGDKREICISRELVRGHTWGEVREVLLHEMAHQYVDQVLGQSARNATPPHGSAFQRACLRLRANPKATGDLSGAGPWATDSKTSSETKMMRRIEKLLALAESQNRNEANAAMTKAHDLITRYNIDVLTSGKRRRYVSRIVGSSALRHPRQDYHLSGLLSDFYFVDGIWISAYVLEKGKMGRALEISGTPQNVDIAEYVHDFIRSFIDARWREYNSTRRLTHHRKTDFAVGIVEGFREKLEAQHRRKKSRENAHALVEIRDPKLASYMAHRYPNTRRFHRTASNSDAGVINDGIRLGKKMVISKAVTDRGGNQGRQIGHRDR